LGINCGRERTWSREKHCISLELWVEGIQSVHAALRKSCRAIGWRGKGKWRSQKNSSIVS